MSLSEKLQPIFAKLSGRAPLCPWHSAISLLNPRLLRVYPPLKKVEVISTEGDFTQYLFANKHSFWFPEGMQMTEEVWSEYLVAFWDHSKNFHRYIRQNDPTIVGRVIYDCGACEGFFSRLCLDRGARHVFAIEPSPIMCQALRVTFQEEIAEKRLTVIERALGSFPAVAPFSFDAQNAFGGQLSAEGLKEVIVDTLDSIASTHTPPDFIKMDLEGFEYEALHGGKVTLIKHKPALSITTYHNPWDFSVLANLLCGMGYQSINPQGVSMRGGHVPRPVILHGTK